MKNLVLLFFFLSLVFTSTSQNLVVDGTISNSANWNNQEAPFTSGTYENTYLSGGCSSNYVMEVDMISQPRQVVSGFVNGATYVLSFRYAYRTSCVASNNPTFLQFQFSDAPLVLNTSLSIPGTLNLLTAYSVTFTNNAASTHTLQLTNPGNTNGCGVIVDDISIMPIVAPGGANVSALSFWLNTKTIKQANNSNVFGFIPVSKIPFSLTPPCANSPLFKTGLASVPDALIANYNPYIVFNGTNQYLQYVAGTVNLLDNSTPGNGATFFAVYQGGSNTTTPFSHQSTNGSRLLARSNELIYANGSATGTNNNTAIVKNSRVNIISSSGKSSGMIVADNNGVAQSNTNGSADADFLTIGVRRSSGGVYNNYFDGSLSEIIIFDTTLSQLNIHQVRSYLASKYGVTLQDNSTTSGLDERSYLASDATTVSWDYASNSDYHNNVSVIGLDLNSGLNQIRSVSTDADTGTNTGNAMLTIDHGSPISSDKSFFAAGHNGTITTMSSADVPSGIQTRLSRIWKFQTTGTGISNSITVNFNMTGFTPLTGNNLHLLVSTSSVFSSATIISGVYNAPYFTASLPTTAGVYFTIGSDNLVSTPLPITLISFDATFENNQVNMAWVTASEQNSDFFTIQRTQNGFDFENIGIHDAAGNSHKKLVYNFTDFQPLPGTSYYRIKLTDLDGVVAYFDLAHVNNEQENLQSMIISPNPNSGTFKLFGCGQLQSEFIEVSIHNTMGEYLIQQQFYCDEKKGIEIKLPDQLQAGIYYCTVRSQTTTQTLKLILK